eukprot:7377557-Prymnesium_polylepis.2
MEIGGNPSMARIGSRAAPQRARRLLPGMATRPPGAPEGQTWGTGGASCEAGGVAARCRERPGSRQWMAVGRRQKYGCRKAAGHVARR